MHNCRAASVITAEPPSAKLESRAEQPEESEISTTFAQHKTTPMALPPARVDGSYCDRGMGQCAPVTPGSSQSKVPECWQELLGTLCCLGVSPGPCCWQAAAKAPGLQ